MFVCFLFFSENRIPTRGQCILTKPVNFKIPVSCAFEDTFEYLIQRSDGRILLGVKKKTKQT